MDIRTPIKWIFVVIVVAVFFAFIPGLLVDVGSISPGDEMSGITISLIQLVALFIPSLAIFMQATLQYSYNEETRGDSHKVGVFDPETYREGVFAAVFLSSLFLTVGLTALIYSLDMPFDMFTGVAAIMTGILLVPALLGFTVLNHLLASGE